MSRLETVLVFSVVVLANAACAIAWGGCLGLSTYLLTGDARFCLGAGAGIAYITAWDSFSWHYGCISRAYLKTKEELNEPSR